MPGDRGVDGPSGSSVGRRLRGEQVRNARRHILGLAIVILLTRPTVPM